MNVLPSLQIRIPKNRQNSITRTPIARTPSTPITPIGPTPIVIQNAANLNPNTIMKANIKRVNVNILTKEAPRSRSSTMTLENFESSNPSSRRSSFSSNPSRRQSTTSSIISEPSSRTQSIANFTGINSQRNLINKPPNYNPNFKIPNTTRKNRVNTTKNIKKNMNVLKSYGSNARNTFKKYKNLGIKNDKIMNLVKEEQQLQRSYNKQMGNKPTKRKWYNPLSWTKTRKLRR